MFLRMKNGLLLTKSSLANLPIVANVIPFIGYCFPLIRLLCAYYTFISSSL